MEKNLSLKKLINELGITYPQFAQRIGVKSETVRRWVSGRIHLNEGKAMIIQSVTGANAKNLVRGTDGVLTVSQSHRIEWAKSHSGKQREDWTFTRGDYCPSTVWDVLSADYQTEHLSWRVKVLLMKARYTGHVNNVRKFIAVRCALDAALHEVAERFGLQQYCKSVVTSESPLIEQSRLQELFAKAFEASLAGGNPPTGASLPEKRQRSRK